MCWVSCSCLPQVALVIHLAEVGGPEVDVAACVQVCIRNLRKAVNKSMVLTNWEQPVES